MSADKLPNIQTLLVDDQGNTLGTNTNPFITTIGGGGSGTVDQGTPNTADNAWSFRLSNGTGFYDGATEAKQDDSNASLVNIDAQLTDIQANQTNRSQNTKITDGTNDVSVLNTTPTGNEWGLGVRFIGTSLSGGLDSAGLLQSLAVGGDDSINSTTGKLKVLPVKANATRPTYTENRNEPLSTDLRGYLRSLVKIEQPPTFVIFAKTTAPSANTSMLSLHCSNVATKKVVIKNIYIVNVQSTAIVGVNNEFQLLRFNNHNNGTSLTPIAHDSADTLSATTTVRSGANIAAELGNIIKLWFLNGDEIIAGAASNQGIQTGLSQFAPELGSIAIKQPTIKPGEGMHVKCVNAGAGTWAVGIVFTEEDV